MSIGNDEHDLAHRVSYRLANGDIPAGFHVHHTCETTLCVNPAHLEAVTPKEHRQAHMPTYCKNGHEFNEETTYWRLDRPGSRNCRACARERWLRMKGR